MQNWWDGNPSEVTSVAMPRFIAIQELADLLGALSHPDRIRIVEELRGGELDVKHLAAALELPQARVSQLLAVLRGKRIVRKRREGRHAFYGLANPRVADWLLEGLDFLEAQVRESEAMRASVEEARDHYSSG